MTDPSSLDAVLDRGASGLRFFGRVLPWRDAAGGPGPSYLDLCAAYDMQRGLEPDALRADGETCRAAATSLREELSVRDRAIGALSEAWTGGAATAAGDVLAAQSTRAGADLDRLDLAAAALVRAADGLHAIVEDKAVAAADHDRLDVGGRALADAEATVAAATQDPSSWSVDTVSRLAAVVPELAAMVAPGAGALWERPDVVEAVRAQCREWTDDVFLPAVDEATASFQRLCEDTHRAVGRIFDVVDTALEGVTTDPYPTPDAPVTPDALDAPVPMAPIPPPAPVPPTATGPASAASVCAVESPDPQPVPTRPVPTQPVPTQPVVTHPAGVVAAAASEDRLAALVRSAVTDAVTAVLDRAEVADRPAETTPCSAGTARYPAEAGAPTGAVPETGRPEIGRLEVGRLEVEGAGHHIRIEVHADGSLDVTAGPTDAPNADEPPPTPTAPEDTPAAELDAEAPVETPSPAPEEPDQPDEAAAPEAPPPDQREAPAPSGECAPAPIVEGAPAAAVAPTRPAPEPSPDPEPSPAPEPDQPPAPVSGARPELAEAGPL